MKSFPVAATMTSKSEPGAFAPGFTLFITFKPLWHRCAGGPDNGGPKPQPEQSLARFMENFIPEGELRRGVLIGDPRDTKAPPPS